MKKIKIIVSGGGTGGHYYPAVAVLKEIKKNYDAEILYFTTDGRIEEKKLKYDFPEAKSEKVFLTGFRRPLYNPANIKIILKMFSEKNRIKKIIKNFNPDFGFMTGGYICGPVGIALKELKIPFYLHEQNSVMGITNKKLLPDAEKVFYSFEESCKGTNCIKTGNPVRTPSEIINRSLLTKYGIKDLSKKIILVMGGSLGSKEIDDIMIKMYEKSEDCEFIHISQDIKKENLPQNIHIFDYIDKMENILPVIDGIISRGGATTISEILFYKINSLIIPWRDAAEDHQTKNALFLKSRGLAEIVNGNDPDYTLIEKFLNNISPKKSDYIYFPEKNPSVEKIVKNIDELK
ncbi:MAG TPA: UDP-N-acetylglucosamine--N-acetylmuramyl-(pentapeptide) pyrophosphoryl-undecaprenol N-acetylglucosamine transferase [Tepiditoga sp.]|nr:UDP-N-acetylglucosamine--N-acetylmuramyl-(pentapeptide) pyrophosphoryl-undecaprenol N-acetylglucosamine transferase [Thermotogota bacterium]HOO74966.1 UDP-N-acetylglucosamine--N-acetylmuramyl-(pentapeptide) pyrophosphoryl-undecaprenol N-acetylglucosamine transferase [Tepiditoga sp.]